LDGVKYLPTSNTRLILSTSLCMWIKNIRIRVNKTNEIEFFIIKNYNSNRETTVKKSEDTCIVIWWSQIFVWWLRLDVEASKRNLQPSNDQLMLTNRQIQYSYLLIYKPNLYNNIYILNLYNTIHTSISNVYNFFT
jgi:hypothetical protein